MTEQLPEVQPAAQEPGQAQPPAVAQKTDTEHMIPKTRFDEANERAKALALENEQLKADKQTAVETQLEQNAQFKELAEKRGVTIAELQPVAETAETYKLALQASNDKRIEAIPEELRTMIPVYDDPVKVGEWLDVNADKLRKPAPPDYNAGGIVGSSGQPPNGVADLSPGELRVAKQFGLTPEEYAKNKDKNKEN